MAMCRRKPGNVKSLSWNAEKKGLEGYGKGVRERNGSQSQEHQGYRETALTNGRGVAIRKGKTAASPEREGPAAARLRIWATIPVGSRKAIIHTASHKKRRRTPAGT